MTSAVRGVLVIGAVLRVVAVAGVTPTIYRDSIEYRDPAFFGGDRRPWTVPLLYEIVGDRSLRVLTHALLGGFAWVILALAVLEHLEDRRARLVTAVAVMAMGCVSSIVNYDAAITVESVAVSLTVLLVAVVIRVLTRPTVGRAVAVVAVAVPFAFTRTDHPFLLAAVAVAMWALSVRFRRLLWPALAVVLTVVTAWSYQAAQRNDEIERTNLAVVIAYRMVPDEDRAEFFVDEGMPLPDRVVPGVGFLDGDTFGALSSDPEWNAWAGREGRWDYARFLLTNPRYTLTRPWPALLGIPSTTLEEEPLTPRPTMLSPGDRYGRTHFVIPAPVEAVLWGPGNPGPVLIAGTWALWFGWRRRRHWRSIGPARAVGAAAVVLGLGQLFFVWHASFNELGRLSIVGSTLIHVGLLICIAVTADHHLRPLWRHESS